MIGSLLLYAGLVCGLFALVLRLLAWRRRRRSSARATGGVSAGDRARDRVRDSASAAMASRRRVRMLTLLAATLTVTALVHPAPERRASGATAKSALDALVPIWQFDERHEVHVDASPARAFAAIRAVTADEILFFQTLTTIRRFGRSGPENILNAPGQQPLIDVAVHSGFSLLASTPPDEVVVGTIVVAPPGTTQAMVDAWRTPEMFAHARTPGMALAAMNFLVRPDGRGGSLVSTETRVFATDAAARWRFGIYWRVIYPGSALIRRMWLRAIRIRAERSAAPVGQTVAGQSAAER